MRLYSLTGDLKSAEELHSYMKARGIPCSTIAFNSLLELYSTTGNIEKAEQIEMEAKATSGNNSLNALAYASLIRVYSEQRQLDQVCRLFDEMCTNISVPPVTAINAVLAAYLEDDASKGSNKTIGPQAWKFFEEQKTRHPNATALMLRTLITTCRKKNDSNQERQFQQELDKILAKK